MADVVIRPDWMFDLRSACQCFYGMTLSSDRWALANALDWLCRSVPAAQSPQEADALLDRLKLCAVDVAAGFHRDYHRGLHLESCAGSPLEAALPAWRIHDPDPRVMFRRWARAFLTSFDATHPPAPSERAAALLRERFTDPPSLNELAAAAAVSRSGLTRDFRRRYRMSCGEYLTRVRLRSFIEAVRRPDRSAAEAGRLAGYESYHNLVDALRRRTGLTPTEIRKLDEHAAAELAARQLPLTR